VAGSVSGAVRAEPNLTPLLDVVFQLITFFMLVINFSNDTYDQRVRLPVAGSARPVEGTREDRVVLNVDRDGNLLIEGKKLDTEKAIKEIALQAELVKLNAKISNKPIDDSNGLPTVLVIRADRDTQFSLLHQLITACQANGFRKFSLKAMTD